jgi:hypothetical protein
MNNKHLRIIVILRDPLCAHCCAISDGRAARAYSQYQHDMRRNSLLPGHFDKDNPFHSKKFEVPPCCFRPFVRM